MPLLFVRDRCLLVASLVVANDRAGVAQLRNSPTATKNHRATLIQCPAHLLGGELRIFPPAAVPCVLRRSPEPPTLAPDVESGPSSRDLQNASDPLPVCPGGTSAPPSSGGRPRPARAPATRPARWPKSTSPPPSPR